MEYLKNLGAGLFMVAGFIAIISIIFGVIFASMHFPYIALPILSFVFVFIVLPLLGSEMRELY